MLGNIFNLLATAEGSEGGTPTEETWSNVVGLGSTTELWLICIGGEGGHQSSETAGESETYFNIILLCLPGQCCQRGDSHHWQMRQRWEKGMRCLVQNWKSHC